MRPLLALVLAAALPIAPAPAIPQEGGAVWNRKPPALENVTIEQRLENQVPGELEFLDESGRKVRLSDYYGERPILLVLAYYECPMLCTLVLNGLTRCMRAVSLDPATDYELVVVSIDPDETPELAHERKELYSERYARAGTDAGWHFLSGSEESIAALADSVGFRYRYLPETDEYAHASALVILTPAGKVARYFFGVEYSARDVKLSLVEASEGRSGGLVEQALLFCYQWNPRTGRYGFAILGALRVAGVLTVLALGGFIYRQIRRDRAPATEDGDA